MRSEYAGRNRPDDHERVRLGNLARALDPITRRALRDLGLGPGWRCLEVGAADGSMSRWMAEQVGDDGRVVAADIDLRFLREVEAPNLEVRSLDLRSDDLEEGHYDLAYCRTLLLHLPDPEAALRRMVASLRPGGLLVAQEPDAGAAAPADLDHPHADDFARILAESYRWLRAEGIFDSYFGRQLGRIFAALPLEDAEVRGHVSLVRGGSVQATLYAQTFEAMAGLLRHKDVVSDADLALLAKLFADPAFEISTEIQYVACGRRPAA